MSRLLVTTGARESCRITAPSATARSNRSLSSPVDRPSKPPTARYVPAAIPRFAPCTGRHSASYCRRQASSVPGTRSDQSQTLTAPTQTWPPSARAFNWDEIQSFGTSESASVVANQMLAGATSDQCWSKDRQPSFRAWPTLPAPVSRTSIIRVSSRLVVRRRHSSTNSPLPSEHRSRTMTMPMSTLRSATAAIARSSASRDCGISRSSSCTGITTPKRINSARALAGAGAAYPTATAVSALPR